MATTATRRSAHTHTPNILDTPTTPPPNHAPRPSISPLSTASKANKQSPIATRDAMMQHADLQKDIERNNATAANGGEEGADEEGEASSELSEPDEDLDDERQGNAAHSALVDEEDVEAQNSLEVDSEAETERLDHTPRGQRKQADAMDRTPSKLSQAATAEDELSDPPSPIPAGAGAASSTSTVATVGQKRKRSGTEDSSLTSANSDLGESPRKRSHELRDAEQERDAEKETVEELVQPVDETVVVPDTPRLDEAQEATPAPRKGPKGKKGRQKGRPPKEPAETPVLHVEETVDAEAEPVEEDPAAKEEALKAKKDAMAQFEMVARQHRTFQEFLNRERLADVARQLEMLHEKDCAHPEYLAQVACVDARFQKQTREAHAYRRLRAKCVLDRTIGEKSQLHSQYFQAVRDLREDVLDKLGEDYSTIHKYWREVPIEKDAAYLYKFPAKRSVQIRQQAKYNQEVSILSGLAKHVGFPAAPDIKPVEGSDLENDLKAMRINPSRQTHHQTASPRQVPRQLSKRAAPPQQQQAPPPHRPVYVPSPAPNTSAHNEQKAHAEFIERNAWAQPQGPLHMLNTPNISHTPDWADQPSTGPKHLMRNLSSQHQQQQQQQPVGRSPYSTPLPQKRGPPDFSSSAGTVAMNNFSDGMEGPPPPSSAIAAPPTGERMSMLGSYGLGMSPLNMPKQRGEQPGSVDGRGDGTRNISNSTVDAPGMGGGEMPEHAPPPPRQEFQWRQGFPAHEWARNSSGEEPRRELGMSVGSGFRAGEG